MAPQVSLPRPSGKRHSYSALISRERPPDDGASSSTEYYPCAKIPAKIGRVALAPNERCHCSSGSARFIFVRIRQKFPMPAVLKLLRPHQYLKNGFVLVGPLFAHQWDSATLIQAALAFLAFCAMASAVYVLNDLLDIEADRAHPTKCKRPLPNGDLSPGFAKGMFGLLVTISMALAAAVGAWVLGFALAYLLLNVVYSWRLKHMVILDVFIISTGFMLRIFAGTIGLGITPSAWLLLCGLMVTLFLGFSKRRAELLVLENSDADYDSAVTRRVLDDYSPAMLEQFIGITAACTVLSYGLYTVSPQTIELHGTANLIYTLPFVVYGIFRYIFLLHRHSKGNDTARDLLTDWHMILAAVAWLAATLWVLA